MRMTLAYVMSWGLVAGVEAGLWSSQSWWVAILIGLACGVPVFLLGAWWASRADE
jgi:hypothetical protein